MRKTFRVSILPRAELDVDAIYFWLQSRSPKGSQAWFLAFEQALGRLATDADTCGSAPEAQRLNRDLKQCLFKTRRGRTYRAVFIIDDIEAIILRVRGPGQPILKVDEI